MNKIKSFTDLDAWKRSHQLRVKIINQIIKLPKDYQFGLSPQLQRSSISVSSNIAEGFGRRSDKEKLRFYNIAEGSLTEVQDQLILCRDLNLIKTEYVKELLAETVEVHKLIRGLMKHIRNSKSKMRDTNV